MVISGVILRAVSQSELSAKRAGVQDAIFFERLAQRVSSRHDVLVVGYRTPREMKKRQRARSSRVLSAGISDEDDEEGNGPGMFC